MSAQPSITVVQIHNPKYDANRPADSVANADISYRVIQTIDTLTVRIGQCLSPGHAQDLIGVGYKLIVKPLK